MDRETVVAVSTLKYSVAYSDTAGISRVSRHAASQYALCFVSCKAGTM